MLAEPNAAVATLRFGLFRLIPAQQMLPDVERTVLRRVGIFAGSFSLHAASAVAIDEEISSARVTDAMASLVVKSMVSADLSREAARYQRLDTIRDYARRKLAEAGELDTVARRHAGHFRDLYATADDPSRASRDRRRPDGHMRAIDDIRVALDWAFSAHGDSSIDVALTVSGIPAWAASILAGTAAGTRGESDTGVQRNIDSRTAHCGAARRLRVPVTFVIFGSPWPGV